MIEVRPAGSGSDEDARLLADRLAMLPAEILDTLKEMGIGAVACRNSVTDGFPHLLDETPRNWPAGMTWEVVPGCYLPGQRLVVVATIGDGAERRIPRTGEKHGSFDLVIHETMHAEDYVGNRRRSENRAFKRARDADREAGGFAGHDYEAKVTEEAYAESAARFFGGDTEMPQEWPDLAQFWKTSQLPLKPERVRRSTAVRGAAPIGTAQQLDDGGFELDLVAESASGAVGHALVTVRVGDPAHAQVQQVFSRRRRSRGEQGGKLLLEGFGDPPASEGP